jgi:hypothetical protein
MPIIGDFGYPGYLAISRLFEFCLGMVMAKVYASNPNLLINYLTKPVTVALAIIFEILGIMGSLKFANNINFSASLFLLECLFMMLSWDLTYL